MKSEKSPIIQIIKKVMPSVVSIIISKSLEELEKELPATLSPLLPFGTPMPKIPEEEIDAHGMVKIGGGSGSIVDEGGIILTNKHVVIDPKAEYTVVTQDNQKHPAEILARDPVNDVAILKIKDVKVKLPEIKLGDSDHLELGQTVIAIGNALGIFRNTVSLGIVSGLSRSLAAAVDLKATVQEMRGLIQTDAAINPGNSGGPLVDSNGYVIGINTAIIFGAQNIGFAIPVNAAKRDLADLKKYGRIRRPLLGLRYIILDEDSKEKNKLPVGYGALIAAEMHHHDGVVPDSPADKAGIKEKDIILECNGEKITKEKTIQDFLENMTVGEIMNLKVLRKKKEFAVKVTLAERK
ncbi:MAG: trypsin-like peptidase domain-containing protein [Candidatus Brennerbacteria bacterium]|nr:trypsin-like peptidase domain-containing protein [Candidatus Brennerbacteria bacterium]